MRARYAVVIAVVALGLGAGLAAQGNPGAVARTPWGDPDIQGMFTTDDELGVPFERPVEFGERPTVTEQEFAEREAQARRQAALDAETVLVRRGVGADGTGPPPHWLECGAPSRRTSIVIDPPDGRIPYLDDEARKFG